MGLVGRTELGSWDSSGEENQFLTQVLVHWAPENPKQHRCKKDKQHCRRMWQKLPKLKIFKPALVLGAGVAWRSAPAALEVAAVPSSLAVSVEPQPVPVCCNAE